MKRVVPPLMLGVIYAILIALAVPRNAVFGSHIDWLCQHVALAETIRDACVAQHTLLPDWLALGGGSNGYQFAYYGYLRLDILLGCLLQQVPMQDIVIGYMLATGLASVLLMYVWLCLETGRQDAAWLCAVLMMTAGCMFHLHRQIMFVNYFPFLLLALICLKKKRPIWVPLCFFAVCLSSFYYAPAVFVVVGWYWYRLEGRAFWREWLVSALLAAGMAAMLLLPTAMALLEHRGAQRGGEEWLTLLTPHWHLNSLLVDKYGIGLSMLALYAMLVMLRKKRLRADVIVILLLALFPLGSYFLNGTLYARAKILMPFLPLVLLVAARFVAGIFEACCEKRQKMNSMMPLWPFVVLVPLLWLWRNHACAEWLLLEVGILLILALLLRHLWLSRWLLMVLLLIAPIGLYFSNAATEDWVSQSALQSAGEGIHAETLAQASADALYHYDSLLQPLEKANLQQGPLTRSSMYSSVTNQKYAAFYYERLMAPVQINNRVALLTADDPFLLRLLGARYVETTRSRVPTGYKVIAESDAAVLAENKEVLPCVYTTEDVVSEAWFNTLTPYAQLDVLARKTVVDDAFAASDGQADMADCSPSLSLQDSLPDGLNIEKTDAGWMIQAKRESRVVLKVENPQPRNILLCQFDVENHTRQPVLITVNGTTNMLSGASAPYPNENTCFHYKFSGAGEAGVQTLTVDFSPGCYEIHDVQWHRYDWQNFRQKKIAPLQINNADMPITGKVELEHDSVLATTIPLQRGFHLYADGQEMEVLRVNTAFAGCRLSAGKHNICVAFSPPGKTAGIVVSIIAMLCYFIFLIKRRDVIIRH